MEERGCGICLGSIVVIAGTKRRYIFCGEDGNYCKQCEVKNDNK